MKGFAHIGVVVAIVVALLGVGYVAFMVRPESPVQLPSPTQSSQTVSLEQIAALGPPAVYTVEYKDGTTGQKLFTIYKDHDKVRHDRTLDVTGQIRQQLFSMGGKEYICDQPSADASWTCFESSEDISMVFSFPENKSEAINLAREGTNANYKGFVGTRSVAGVEAPCFASEWRSEAVRGNPLETATSCYHPQTFLKLVDQSVLGNRNIVAERISFDPIPPRMFVFPDAAFTPQNGAALLVDISNWRTYRNDEFGIEFRYPAAINGKTVTPIVQSTNPRDALALGLYSSSMPFAPPYPPEYGIRGAPSLHNVLGVQVVDLKRPPHYFSTGHFGGFEYNPGRDRWRETDGEGGYVRELTWDSFLTAVSAKPFGRDIFLVTATSPAGGGDYINDPRTRYYYLMNREQKKYAVVQHFAFADISPTAVQDSIRAQFNVEADTVSDIARQMLDTLTFLPRAPEGSSVVPMPSAVPSSAAPTIRTIVPNSGPVGTQVTITGSGFTATHNTVKLMDSTGVLTADQVTDLASGNGTLTFVLPNIATAGLCVDPAPNPPPGSGPYGCFQLNPRKVVVTNAYGDSNSVNFEITPGNLFPPITITNISPTSGRIGTRVALMGSGFAPTGNHVVFRNATMIAYVSSIPSSDGSSITFTVPTSGSLTSGLTPGNPSSLLPGFYTLTVSNPNRTDSSNSVDFTVTASP